jgi:hypothetical protein
LRPSRSGFGPAGCSSVEAWIRSLSQAGCHQWGTQRKAETPSTGRQADTVHFKSGRRYSLAAGPPKRDTHRHVICTWKTSGARRASDYFFRCIPLVWRGRSATAWCKLPQETTPLVAAETVKTGRSTGLDPKARSGPASKTGQAVLAEDMWWIVERVLVVDQGEVPAVAR